MKRIMIVAVALGMAAAANAELLFKVTFDNAAAGPWSTGVYVPGPGEVVSNITGGAADPGIEPIPNGATIPEIQPVASIPAINSPVQGGMALVTHAGSTPDGVYIDFDPGFGPAGSPVSMTVELVFLLKTFPVPGNTADISNLFSTEWPGGALNWNIRTIGTSLNFVVANTDGEVGITAPPAGPIVLPGLAGDRWYHVAGVLNYNAGNPAASTLELFLGGLSQGPAVINLSEGKYTRILGNSHTTRGHMIALGVNAGNAEGYWSGDDRGLDGAISAVAVSSAALSPDTFVLTSSASVSDWSLFE
jgi:hypothetical protein